MHSPIVALAKVYCTCSALPPVVERMHHHRLKPCVSVTSSSACYVVLACRVISICLDSTTRGQCHECHNTECVVSGLCCRLRQVHACMLVMKRAGHCAGSPLVQGGGWSHLRHLLLLQ